MLVCDHAFVSLQGEPGIGIRGEKGATGQKGDKGDRGHLGLPVSDSFFIPVKTLFLIQ